MQNEFFSTQNFEKFEFDFLYQIVLQNQKDKNKIIKEYPLLKKYFIDNPLPEYTDKFGNLIKENLYKLDLKDDYILDNFKKIYNQILLYSNEYLLSTNLISIYYYVYDEKILDSWENNGILLGDTDEIGNLNTGTKILFKAIELDWRLFMVFYSEECN